MAFAIACLVVAVLVAGAAEPGAPQPGEQYKEPIGPEPASTPGDDDPRIDPGEVIAPSIDSRDIGWQPLWKSYENPASLNCGGRAACETYKAGETSKAATSTGAQR